MERACKAIIQKELSLPRKRKLQLVSRTHAQVCFSSFQWMRIYLFFTKSRGLRSMQRKIRDVDCVIEVGFPKSNLMNRWPGSWCQNTIQWEESNFSWRGWRSQTPSSRPQQSRSDSWVRQRSHQKGVDETESTHIQSALYQLQDLLLSGNGGHHPHSVQTCWCWGQVFVTWSLY